MDLSPAWMKGLTPKMVLIAEKELGETEKKRTESLEELKILIKEEKSKGFCPLQDEEFLLRFLRARKYDVTRAFSTLKNYYLFKSEYSGTMTDLSPKELNTVLDLEYVFISPKRALEGEGLLVVSAGSIDFSVCTIEEVFAIALIGAEVGLATEASQVCGCRMVIDLQGISWRMFKHFIKPTFLRCFARCVQDVVPCRIKGIHMANQPVYFDLGFSAIKHFLSQKITDRIHLHGSDFESLHQYIPPEALPESLGGHLGKEDFEDFRTVMLQNTPLMERLNSYIYNGVQSNPTYKDIDNSNATINNLFKILSK